MVRTIDLRPWFTANFKGKCASCLLPFEAGESIRRNPQDERQYIGSTCCGDLALDHTRDDDGPDLMMGNRTVVMPRGKTAKDMCPRCFIVPSSNGSCDCDG